MNRNLPTLDLPTMKLALLNQVITLLETDLETLSHAAAQTHRESTSAESKQEGKYDTRGLEASYLADAQAEQVVLLQENIIRLKTLEMEDDADIVKPGSIAILSSDSNDHQFFLLPAGGGIELQYEGQALTVITPESPIGALILGKTITDTLSTPQLGDVFVSEIY